MDRLTLATLPTPIHALPRWSARLGVQVDVKRDDLTGFLLSGNKVRKLERVLAAAVHQGADTVITCGGLQSNHCRATALAARQLGLEPVLLLRDPAQRWGRDLAKSADGNLLLDVLVDAEIHTCTAVDYRDHRDAIMADLAAQLRARGKKPFVVPEGGSNGLGARAYADATEEVADRYDAVFVAVGSGGTLAGLAMGKDIGPIKGVAVCDDKATFAPRVRAIAHEAGVDIGSPGDRWDVLDGYQGHGYGLADPPLVALIREVARLEGLVLDPTYTGKAMQGLAGEVRAGRVRGRVLFWHTGGTFGWFGRGAELLGEPETRPARSGG